MIDWIPEVIAAYSPLLEKSLDFATQIVLSYEASSKKALPLQNSFHMGHYSAIMIPLLCSSPLRRGAFIALYSDAPRS